MIRICTWIDFVNVALFVSFGSGVKSERNMDMSGRWTRSLQHSLYLY